MEGWIDEWKDGLVDGQMEGRKGKREDGWMNGLIERWMDDLLKWHRVKDNNPRKNSKYQENRIKIIK